MPVFRGVAKQANASGLAALSLCLACGGTAAAGPGLQETLRDLNDGLARDGLTLEQDGWLELTLGDEGWTRSQDIEAGECLTAVVVSDTGSVVFVEIDDRSGEESDGASWQEVCVDEDRSVVIDLVGPPETPVAFAVFVGPRGGDAFVRSYFGPAPVAPAESREPSTPSGAPAQLDVSSVETTERCGDDEAREHYRRGIRLAREESFDAAADALALAYACQADGTILFNLASVTAQQGKLDEAREMYVQLLRDHPNIPQSLRGEVESALETLRRPGTLIVRMRRGDEVFINDVGIDVSRRRTVRRLRVRVMPGSHTVVLRDAAGSRHEVHVRSEAGGEVEVDPRRTESP